MNINEHLKSIILQESGVNVEDKTRKREVVELRALYFKLLRDLDPRLTFDRMGKTVGVHHATVIHSLNNYDIYEKYNDALRVYKETIIDTLNISGIEDYKVVDKVEVIRLLQAENNVLKGKLEASKIEFDVLDRINELLKSSKGTNKFNVIEERLESLYNFNK